MKEANIIKKFREKIPGHWTSIENSVKSGVPDYALSHNGDMCWIEFKRLYGCDIILRPLQRVWMLRELKHNTRVFVAWWEDGPVLVRANYFLELPFEEKRGKLYYDVSTLAYDNSWQDIISQIHRD
jgi:hypothetical protein